MAQYVFMGFTEDWLKGILWRSLLFPYMANNWKFLVIWRLQSKTDEESHIENKLVI